MEDAKLKPLVEATQETPAQAGALGGEGPFTSAIDSDDRTGAGTIEAARRSYRNIDEALVSITGDFPSVDGTSNDPELQLGDLGQVPVLRVSADEILRHKISHDAAFLLSRIDGATSYEDILSISGMTRCRTLALFSQLIEQGLIGSKP
jgi:hypothetical protein